MIPLISSLAYGPLGACQLPRTWWKTLAHAAGILDAEYPYFSHGLDHKVFEVLGLDRAFTLAYLQARMPSYLDFEAWILKKKGDEFWGFERRDAIVRWNASVRARHHQAEKIEETYTDAGLPRDAGITSATVLNSLQDWQLFYKRDLHALSEPVVPLIATIDFGPLGVRQLPRTWYKIILKAKGALHPDYPHMTDNGLDPRVLRVLGLDIDATVNYISEEMPSYLEFEDWVREQCGGQIPAQAVEEWNDYLCNRIHNEAKRAEILATLGRGNDMVSRPIAIDPDVWGGLSTHYKLVNDLRSAVVLNHIEDWHLAYQSLVNRRF